MTKQTAAGERDKLSLLAGITERGRAALRCALSFLVGLFLSRTTIFGLFTPFGLTYTASVPLGGGALFGAAGSLLGYLTMYNDMQSIRYLSGVLVIVGVRYFVAEIAQFAAMPYLEPLLAACVCGTTGIAVLIQNTYSPALMIFLAVETALCGLSVVFFKLSRAAAAKLRGGERPGEHEIISLLLVFCIGLLAVSPVRLFSLSAARILGLLILLFAAFEEGIAGGSVAGVIIGITLSLASPTLGFIAASYGFAGFMAGACRGSGKFGVAICFVLTHSVVTAYFGEESMLLLLVEAMIASVCFMLIPAKLASPFFDLLTPPAREAAPAARTGRERQTAKVKLQRTVSSIRDMSERLFHAPRGGDVTPDDLSSIYNAAASATCKSCGLNVYCWGRDYNTTMAALSDSTPALLKNRALTPPDIAAPLREKCIHLDGFVENINAQYQSLLSTRRLREKMTGERDLLEEMYGSLAACMEEIAEDFDTSYRFDGALEKKVASFFKERRAPVKNVLAYENEGGHMMVEILLSSASHAHFSGDELRGFVEAASGRRFGGVSVTQAGAGVSLKLRERENLRIVCDKSIAVKQGESFSGDSMKSYLRDDGKFIVALSDGMGSGREAAAESDFALTTLEALLEAGLKRDTALRLLSSALCIKSGDACFATLDVGVFDLYTGAAEFVKAGAAPSFVIRGGEIYKIESSSLPAGILAGAPMEENRCKLEPGDIVLMVSDGVVSAGEDGKWLLEIVSNYTPGDGLSLSKHIIAKAREFSLGREDDMSCAVLTVQKLDS